MPVILCYDLELQLVYGSFLAYAIYTLLRPLCKPYSIRSLVPNLTYIIQEVT
jgi:hypothetical protein